MKETDNLKLKLPEENDWADVGALNENFRALDRAAGKLASGLGVVKTAPLVIPADGWTETGEQDLKYTAEVPQKDAKATHIPIVSLHRDSLAVAEAAGMCSSAETVDGAVRFWARKVPAENLEATLALLTPGTGELGAAGGGSAYVLPVATTETPAGVTRVRAAKTPEAEMSGEYWVMKGKG